MKLRRRATGKEGNAEGNAEPKTKSEESEVRNRQMLPRRRGFGDDDHNSSKANVLSFMSYLVLVIISSS